MAWPYKHSDEPLVCCTPAMAELRLQQETALALRGDSIAIKLLAEHAYHWLRVQLQAREGLIK